MNQIRFAILTVSDSCAAGIKQDSNGPVLKETVSEQPNYSVVQTAIVPKVVHHIQSCIVNWIDYDACDVVLTTGGTGIGVNDVTGEATEAIIDKKLSGVTTSMLINNLQKTALAMLSRSACGVRRKALVINMPDSPKGVMECFNYIKPVLDHAVILIKNGAVYGPTTQQSNFSNSKVVPVPSASRDRTSQNEMISFEKATDIITSTLYQESEYECIDIMEGLNRILAETIMAKENIPYFRTSIVDGYALKSGQEPDVFRVIGVIGAGDEPGDNLNIGPLECVRISTGAPVPEAADVVIKVEDTAVMEEENGEELTIEIGTVPPEGENIRDVGSEMLKGMAVFARGICLDSAAIGVLAALGYSKVKVYKQPRIGVLSTGNGIVSHTVTLKPGKIRDRGKAMLVSLFESYNFPVIDCFIALYTSNEIKWAFERAFQKCEFLITTVSVSMRDLYLMKKVLLVDFHATIHLDQVNMGPGDAFSFATCTYNGQFKYVFVLPSQQCSAMLSSILLVLPALAYVGNRRKKIFKNISVVMGNTIIADKRKNSYHCVRITRKPKNGDNQLYELYAESTGNRISSRLNSFFLANGVVVVPQNTNQIKDNYANALIWDMTI